jgi:MFS superfamily sulfate permease-like transporter
VAGLYATMLPLAAYALFTSSRQVMVGPDGTLAVLTATAVAPLAGGNPTRYAALAAALAMMAGVILLASAALRLGFMADFLSVPILIGYLNGIALIIIASQVGRVFGMSILGPGDSCWSAPVTPAGSLSGRRGTRASRRRGCTPRPRASWRDAASRHWGRTATATPPRARP